MLSERPAKAWDPLALLDRIRRRIRSRQMSRRTEETYVRWIERYLLFHGGRHPASLGRADLQRFVSHLANQAGLGAQSQNQAASSVVFLYRELYGQNFGGRHGVVRAREPKILPKYVSPDDMARVLARLEGVSRMATMLMYGSGTRLTETLSIRLKDLSLETKELHIRSGKGAKDRTTLIGDAAVGPLERQIEAVREQHEKDRAHGDGWAPLPGAMHRKDPRAGWDIGWQYLFPSTKTSIDEKTDRMGRRPVHVSNVQRAIKAAGRDARITRPISPHVLRHCFASEMLRAGCDLRLLQRLMGHRNLRSTARYLHILDRPGIGLVSPLDRLPHPEQPA